MRFLSKKGSDPFFFLLVMSLASCTSSTDKELSVDCERLIKAVKMDNFINYNWSRVKPIFNQKLPELAFLYYGKKVSDIKFPSSEVGISWKSIGVSDYSNYVTIRYRNEYREELLKQEENIQVSPHMIDRVYVGIYQARLLYLLKPPSEMKLQRDVDKLDYELYVECNGRVPENYPDLMVEPEHLLRIK